MNKLIQHLFSLNFKGRTSNERWCILLNSLFQNLNQYILQAHFSCTHSEHSSVSYVTQIDQLKTSQESLKHITCCLRD